MRGRCDIVMIVFFGGISVLQMGCGGGKEDVRMTEPEYDSFVQDCRTELRQKISTSVDKWKLDKFGRFDFDQTKGQLIFSEGPTSQLICEVQIVGTFSTESQTWLWAWGSPWTVENLKNDSLAVREFGAQHGFERLTTRKWTAEEKDGWDMTAIAARVVGTEGAYRLPNDKVMIFMLLKKIQEGTTD
jgi:hypothetical protein